MPVQQRKDPEKFKNKVPRRVIEFDSEDPHPIEAQESWDVSAKAPRFFDGTKWVTVITLNSSGSPLSTGVILTADSSGKPTSSGKSFSASDTPTDNDVWSALKTKTFIESFAFTWSGDLSLVVPKTTKVNGHALSGDINVTLNDLGITDVGGKLVYSGKTLKYEAVVELVTGTTVLSDAQSVVLINSISDCNIFLPVGVNNQAYRMRNVGAGKVTFIANGTDTVENASSYLLLTTNAFDLIFYSGNWYIF